jgi:hypothetical protein
VGFAPTGKRRLATAHPHSSQWWAFYRRAFLSPAFRLQTFAMLVFRDALILCSMPVADLVRRHRIKKRYAKVLREIYGEAVQWVSFIAVKHIVFSIAQRISESPAPQQLMKGEPDLSPIRQRCATIILDCIDLPVDSTKGQDMLRAAERIASLFPDDIDAFRLYVAVFWLVNYTVITSLRDVIRAPYVAVHLTCRPRMERAASSIVSFAAIPSHALAHVTLIGNGSTFAFDAGKNILEVPAVTYTSIYRPKCFVVIKSLSSPAIRLALSSLTTTTD